VIDYLEIARRALQRWQTQAEPDPPQLAKIEAESGTALARARTEPLELVLKGQAIELWSTAAGRLFLVADEADARLTMERFAARRGEIYTAAEARRIVTVNDKSVVAEIHEWKRRFDGTVR